jgi:hypothetical protein
LPLQSAGSGVAVIFIAHLPRGISIPLKFGTGLLVGERLVGCFQG